MANTIKYSGFTIEISAIDSDWTWTDTLTDPKFANGVPVNFIQFNPAASNDKCSIKEASDAGPQSYYVKCTADTDQKRAYFYGTKLKPVLDFSAGTFTANSTVIVQLSKEAPH